jgi:GNAT superfamily N-acetyltransferase
MHISTLRPAEVDGRTATEMAELRNRAAAVDAPHMPEETGEMVRLRLVHGWDGEPTDRVLLVRDERGALLGLAEVELPSQENLNVVWFLIVVDPAARRQGIGSALLEHVVAASEDVGRGVLMTGAWIGSAGMPFLKRHEFEQASTAAQRRLYPHELPRPVDVEMLEKSRAASTDYELIHIAGRLPEDMLESMVSTVDAINDAPLDDLELEDENYTVDRLRRYDAAQQAQQQRLYRIIARSRIDGSPAAHTVVAVDGRRPHIGEQHDTSVRPEHRGHRLGMRLKLELLEWLREVEPQLRLIDTWNQESNSHMIAVNDAIGCSVVGREAMFQKHVR